MTTKRRWLRFNLRAGMGLVVVCGVLLALVVVPAQRRKQAFVDIRAAGGTIALQPGAEDSWSERIVSKALGPDATAKVHSVYLRKAKIDDGILASLGAFPEIEILELEGFRSPIMASIIFAHSGRSACCGSAGR